MLILDKKTSRLMSRYVQVYIAGKGIWQQSRIIWHILLDLLM